MKFKNTAADYQSTVNQGKKMGFAPEAESFLMDMMSDGLYSDKYGSIVRELTSNAIDANVESGKQDDAVRISLTAPSSFTNQGEIAFTDSGIGISPERIDDIFTLYFASTKRDDNEMIGGFGIGAKSPFAYTDVFRVETWFENVKRTYLMEKRGQDRTCTLLSETPDEGNGTVIRIPIKDRYDYSKFVEAVNEQTLLMRPIAVELVDDNEYVPATVYEFETFYIALDRNGQPVQDKVALGNVVYDYRDGQDIYNTYRGIPIIPKLEIGQVMPTMSRESLQLTDAATDYIADRYHAVREELQAMADAQGTETDNLIEALQGRRASSLTLPDGVKFDMDWAQTRMRRTTGDLVTIKGLTYSKFPKAPLGEVATYCSSLLEVENEWQESSRGYNSKFRWSKQNADFRPIAVLLGNVSSGSYWKKEAEIVRGPQNVKITAADKEYIAETFSEHPLLFVSRKSEPEQMAISGYASLIAQSGSLPAGKTNAEVLYERFGKQFLLELKEHSVHADNVLATEEWKAARKERMAEERKSNKTDKKARANDQFRMRGLGIRGVADDKLEVLLKHNPNAIYLTRAEWLELKETKDDYMRHYTDSEWIVEQFEKPSKCYLFEVSAKTAKEFDKMGVFTPYLKWRAARAQRSAYSLEIGQALYITTSLVNGVYSNLRHIFEEAGISTKDLTEFHNKAKKFGFTADATLESTPPDTVVFMGKTYNVKRWSNIVKRFDAMQEGQPFLYGAVCNMRNWNQTFNKEVNEAVGYFFPNRVK